MRCIRGKCALIGHQAVGKTALSNALVESRKEFPYSYRMTVVPKLNVRNIHLQDVSTDVEFLIYDYPGSPVYHDLFEKFVGTTDVFVLMFDVTDRSSFEACPLWTQKLKKLAKNSSVPGILIGNKTDLISLRDVTETEARQFAEEIGIKYCELSIKEARNVLEPFNILARDFYKLYQTTAGQFREML